MKKYTTHFCFITYLDIVQQFLYFKFVIVINKINLLNLKCFSFFFSSYFFATYARNKKSEYSCMPLPQIPVVTYLPEQSTQETQITNETSESETQTSGVSTESQKTQVAADTTEMTTQTKSLVQNEMTTQTKTLVQTETTTQTKSRPQAETTTQTKVRPLTETTTQTKARPLTETTTQTVKTTTTIGADTSEMTTQTKQVAQNDAAPHFDQCHDDEDRNVPVSDVKIVLEMHADDDVNNVEEAEMVDFPPPDMDIIDGVESGSCCNQSDYSCDRPELCSACPELSAVSGVSIIPNINLFASPKENLKLIFGKSEFYSCI
jgi:hypothetical protein